MLRRSQLTSIQDSIDSLNKSTRDTIIWSATKMLREIQADAGIRGDIVQTTDRIFHYSFWNKAEKQPINEVEHGFLLGQIKRVSSRPYHAHQVAEAVTRRWHALGWIEAHRDANDGVIRLSESGRDLLKNEHDSLPRAYLIFKDVVRSPISKLAAIVGFAASLLALYQWWSGGFG